MRSFVKTVVWLLVIVAIGAVLYFAADPEKLDIDENVRRMAPGRFVKLSDGFTHYEIGGPASGRTVVLAAGVSVPYYIWDPTFMALTDAGLRVLRYDYYGRGYSDRPDVAYSQDLYVRQLAELLDAVHITDPIDLAGLSYGGSVVTSFADRFPDRVRSLVYVDPSFWSPYNVTSAEDAAGLGLPDRHFRRAMVGRRTARRLPAPGAIPRLAGSLQGTDALSRLPARSTLDQRRQRRHRSVSAAEACRGAPPAGARVLGKAGSVGTLRVQHQPPGSHAARTSHTRGLRRAPAAVGTARGRPSAARRLSSPVAAHPKSVVSSPGRANID